MVKIIKKEPDKSVVKQIICRNCGATLEYVPNDVHESNGRDISGGPDNQTWIDCPNCNKKVIISNW